MRSEKPPRTAGTPHQPCVRECIRVTDSPEDESKPGAPRVNFPSWGPKTNPAPDGEHACVRLTLNSPCNVKRVPGLPESECSRPEKTSTDHSV
jgi:hypothetical protein